MNGDSEVRELYRLIDGHCDWLLGCKSSMAAREQAKMLRARAREIKARQNVNQQLTINGEADDAK